MPENRLDIILRAYDKMTAPINAAVNKAQAKLSSFAKKADKTADKSFKIGQQLVGAGLAMGAPVYAAVQKAMDFEEAMADVAKVMNIQNGSAELRAMGEEAQKLGIYLGRGANDAAVLMASLAAGGVPRQELMEVTRMAGEMGIAFDMSAEDAGDRFVKLKNSMNLTVSATKAATDAMNHLSDNDASKAREILDFMAQGGASAAQGMNMTAPQMSAIGSAFLAIGKSADVAGTTIKRVQKALVNDSLLNSINKKAGGGLKGFMEVMNTGANLHGDAKDKYFQRFGEYGNELKELSFNMKKVRDNIKLVAEESNYADSVSKEFNNRMNTTAGRLAKVRAQAEVVAIKLGESLLPAIVKITDRIAPLIDKFGAWVKRNPELAGGIMKTAAVLSAAALAGGYLAFVVGGIARLFSITASAGKGLFDVVGWLTDKKKGLTHQIFVVRYRMLQFSEFITGKALPALSKLGKFLSSNLISGIRLVGQAFMWMGRVLLTNPIILIITAVALAAFLIIKNWDKVKKWFSAFGVWLKRNWDIILAIFLPVLGIPILFIRRFNKIKEWFTGILPFLKEGGKKIIMTITNAILSVAMAPVKALAWVGKKLRNLLPFSPAKEGPLKDLHKIKIVETIADTLQPQPVLKAWNKVVKPIKDIAFNLVGGPASVKPALAATNGSIVANFNIHLNGSATKNDGALIAAECKKQFSQLMQQYNNQRARVSF